MTRQTQPSSAFWPKPCARGLVVGLALALLTTGCLSRDSPTWDDLPPGAVRGAADATAETAESDATEDAPDYAFDFGFPDDVGPPKDTAPDVPVCVPDCDGKKCFDGCGGGCNGEPCDDWHPCTDKGVCELGACSPGPWILCDDGDDCTYDACLEAKGCVFTPLAGSSCDDGDPCTVDTVCDLDGACSGGKAQACDDGQPCTADVCKPDVGCTFEPVAAPLPCTGTGGDGDPIAGTCQGGVCCSCPSGLACNAWGGCVAADTCVWRCGDDGNAGGDGNDSCACDTGCVDRGDCCADYADTCTGCVEGAIQLCVSGAIQSFNSCYVAEGETPCPFGCTPGAPTCHSDPCANAPPDGLCNANKSGYQQCLQGPDGAPKLGYTACDAGDVCVDSVVGAFCLRDPDSCVPGDVRCDPDDPDEALRCVAAGQWVSLGACASCRPTAVRSILACPGDTTLAKQTNTLAYEHVLPFENLTGINTDSPSQRLAPGTLVVAVSEPAPGSPVTVYDAARVAADGSFTLRSPTQPTQFDFVLAVATLYDDKGDDVVLSVHEPKVQGGEIGFTKMFMLDGEPWSWSIKTGDLLPNAVWTIGFADQGWPLQVFQNLRFAVETTRARFGGQPGLSLVTWLAYGVSWACGSCFSDLGSAPIWGDPTYQPVERTQAASQIWLAGPPALTYTDAVVLHEAGHWALASYGDPQGEAGVHYLGTRVPPRLEWGEGFATFYTAMNRGDGLYYSGSDEWLYSVDIGSPEASGTFGALLPYQAEDLLQWIDELRISSTLWLAAEGDGNPMLNTKNQPFWDAIGSQQLTDGKYTRGYKAQEWTTVTPTNDPPNYVTYAGLKSTDEPAPTLPDFLDAMVCTTPAWAERFEPLTGVYPYNYSQPICPYGGQP